jgi:hypothetical protein
MNNTETLTTSDTQDTGQNNTTLYELDTAINLCMVVSNTYGVVLFVLFSVVMCLVYGCVQLI